MSDTVEGKYFIRTWSLTHEGLLDPIWPDRYKPIHVWTSTFYASHRELEKLKTRFPIRKIPVPPIRPDLTHGSDSRAFRIFAGENPSKCVESDITVVSSLRRVEGNAGLRWWFLCRTCDGRTSALYFGEDWKLRCRLCLDLVYQSERLSHKQRARYRG
jgi:hypothetical protein